jgi:hypothetical protein
MCGPKRDDITGELRKLHSEELHILYSSPNIIRQIKSRRMRWGGGTCGTHGRGEKSVKVFGGKATRDHLEVQGVNGKMESEWVLGRLTGECRVDSVGSGYGPLAGSCEYGDEPSGSAPRS